MSKSQGFTILELVVVIAIFAVLGLGIITLVSSIFTGSNQQAALLADTDQARRLTFRFAGELRNATTSSTGAFALAEASAQQIVFYSNIDKDSGIERLRYYIQNGKLYRGIVEPTGSPASYNLASETTTAVQNNVGNDTTPLFYYYNDDYDGTPATDTPLAQPVGVLDVKYVKMNLMIYNKAGVQNTNTYTVTSGAAIRGLKENLGN